jgi:hypothetical protein
LVAPTPPIDLDAEIRCCIRDPDGYLIEVGQSTSRNRARQWYPMTASNEG